MEKSSWHLDLDAARVHIHSVPLSSKLAWVFGPLIAFPVFFLEEEVTEEGPLRIHVSVESEPGSQVAFDVREFRVHLEDGRSLSPEAVLLWGSGVEEVEPPAPVTLWGEQIWHCNLQYAVALSELAPFTLQPGNLSVNGQAVQLPRLSFVAGRLYSGD